MRFRHSPTTLYPSNATLPLRNHTHYQRRHPFTNLSSPSSPLQTPSFPPTHQPSKCPTNNPKPSPSPPSSSSPPSPPSRSATSSSPPQDNPPTPTHPHRRRGEPPIRPMSNRLRVCSHRLDGGRSCGIYRGMGAAWALLRRGY